MTDSVKSREERAESRSVSVIGRVKWVAGMAEWATAWIVEQVSLRGWLRLTKQYFGIKVRELDFENGQELANALQRAQMMRSFIVREGQDDA